ncbi:hypothetical protein O1611_g1640 [Lasiodiplodia mahajangana]|uniref:Uncharacterized protein n=1 Tax=Lasiodiplodia mahajangana TaxID=1108764 RepID=A0ACC2JX34_9PEZI|nr:hypothetical protein O1611_g1640 [Lasiodiplodia mahajangana]
MAQNLREDTLVFTQDDEREQMTPDPTFDLPWYSWWVLEQIRKQPSRLLSTIRDYRPNESSTIAIHTLWNRIRHILLAAGPKSVDSIADTLVNRNFVDIESSYEAVLSVKDLVFSIIGLQTMLYQPYFDLNSPGSYQIFDEMSGYQGATRLNLCQSSDSSARDLSDFLLGFGLMLPPSNYCVDGSDDDQQVFNKIKTVIPGDIDAYVLSRLCGVRFQWVDSLSCHLELDKHSGTLFLYRYPSFCVSSIRQYESSNENEGRKSALHSCAAQRSRPLPWADEESVTGLLREILLSYRVIFGQNRRSRGVFRKLRPFASIPKQGRDQSLAEFCGKKLLKCPFMPIEQQEYDLANDFPHLRSRVAQLSSYASRKKPRSVRRLWRDRRDSPSWLAYWSALAFGLMGLFLVLIQTVFQILQYVESIQDGNSD